MHFGSVFFSDMEPAGHVKLFKYQDVSQSVSRLILLTKWSEPKHEPKNEPIEGMRRE